MLEFFFKSLITLFATYRCPACKDFFKRTFKVRSTSTTPGTVDAPGWGRGGREDETGREREDERQRVRQRDRQRDRQRQRERQRKTKIQRDTKRQTDRERELTGIDGGGMGGTPAF